MFCNQQILSVSGSITNHTHTHAIWKTQLMLHTQQRNTHLYKVKVVSLSLTHTQIHLFKEKKISIFFTTTFRTLCYKASGLMGVTLQS